MKRPTANFERCAIFSLAFMAPFDCFSSVAAVAVVAFWFRHLSASSSFVFFLRLFFHLFLFPRSSLTDDVSFAASNETLCVFGPFFVLFLMKAQQQQEETRQPTEIKRNSVRKKNPVKYIRSVMRNQLGPFEANQLRFDLIPMKNSVKLGKTRWNSVKLGKTR